MQCKKCNKPVEHFFGLQLCDSCEEEQAKWKIWYANELDKRYREALNRKCPTCGASVKECRMSISVDPETKLPHFYTSFNCFCSKNQEAPDIWTASDDYIED